MRDGFFDHRNDADKYAVDGAYLNKTARTTNPSSFRRPSGYSQHEMQGHLAGASSIPPTIIGVAVITSHENTCEVSTDSQESFDAPCRRDFLYRARFRHYDFEEKKWLEREDDDFDLDASWTRDLSSDASIDLPSMPPLQVGDQVVVGYDEQRDRFIPLYYPARTYVARTSSSGIRGRCGTQVCVADVQIVNYDNDLDPTDGDCHDLEPALNADEGLVTRKCANLGVANVPGNSFVLIHQDGLSGTFFTLGVTASKLHKGRARGCHNPGSNMAYDLMEYNINSETWQFTGRVVLVQDPHHANFVLPGEIIWIVQGDSSAGGMGIDECAPELNPSSSNTQRPWFTLGSYGLFRMAKATSEIDCYSYGAAEIFYHQSSQSCDKSDGGCIVPICNDWGFPKKIEYAEQLKIKYFERRWVVVNEPAPILARATLDVEMLSTDETATVTLVRFMDRCSQETGVQEANNDLCLHGAVGDVVILARDPTLEKGWLVLAVKQHPHILLAQTFSGGISAYDGTELGSGLVNIARRRTTDDAIVLVAGAESIISVFNAHGKIRGNSNIFIIREEHQDDWYVLEPMMPIVSGQQVGALDSMDASNEIDNITYLAGFDPRAASLIVDATTQLTAANAFGWDADDNAVTYAFLDADGNWKMFQVQCPA